MFFLFVCLFSGYVLKVEQAKLVQGLLFSSYLTLNKLLNLISVSASEKRG